MIALTNFLSERRKPKYNPKILVDFPFNYVYKVKQMKHNHFKPKKLHRSSECEKKTNFLSERQKFKYNPKMLVDFPFNNLYKVNQKWGGRSTICQ